MVAERLHVPLRGGLILRAHKSYKASVVDFFDKHWRLHVEEVSRRSLIQRLRGSGRRLEFCQKT